MPPGKNWNLQLIGEQVEDGVQMCIEGTPSKYGPILAVSVPSQESSDVASVKVASNCV